MASMSCRRPNTAPSTRSTAATRCRPTDASNHRMRVGLGVVLIVSMYGPQVAALLAEDGERGHSATVGGDLSRCVEKRPQIRVMAAEGSDEGYSD